MPAPRCTLAYQGRNSCTARFTTTDAELVAAVSRSTYCRGPPSSTDTHKSSPTYWPAVNDGVISMIASSNGPPRNLRARRSAPVSHTTGGDRSVESLNSDGSPSEDRCMTSLDLATEPR